MSLYSSGSNTEQPLEITDLVPVGGRPEACLTVGPRIEHYNPTEIPTDHLYFVTKNIDTILSDIDLDEVLYDLDRAGDFIFLAYNGCKGVKGIAASVGDRQSELLQVCSSCVISMEVFKSTTTDILQNICSGFTSVYNGREEEAIILFSQCASQAGTMSTQCESLAGKFKDLMDKTKEDNAKVVDEVGSEEAAMKKYKELHAQMESNLASQKAQRDDLETGITRLKEQIEEETQRQKTESDREFAGKMIRMVAGAFSAAAGGVAQSLTEQQETETEGDKNAGGTKGGKGAAAAAKGASAGANFIKTGGNDIADGSASTSEASYDVRLTLIQQKRRLEDLNREALTTIAELQAKVGNNESDQGIAESAVAALQIAVFAFGRIYKALSNAKFFWDHMQSYCNILSKDKTISLIKEELKYAGSDKAERIAYYESDMFLPNAIMYTVRWKALEIICGKYVDAANKARDNVSANMMQSPTVAQAKILLPALHEKLRKSIQDEKDKIAIRDAALNKVEEMVKLQKALAGGK